MRVSACGQSDPGRVRSHNEDSFEIDAEHELFVVADGMGGHSHGEVASRMAVDAIREFVRQAEEDEEDQTWPFAYEPALARHSNVLRAAVRLAHDQVLSAIRRDGNLYGMGTTVVGCLVRGGIAAVAHVGDSRAYRHHGGRLELLTQDHTWVNEQVVAGFLSERQARDHPLKNVVTRALGGDHEVAVDVVEVALEPGDTILLCSDGLTTMLDDREIARVLERCSGDGLDGTCEVLIREANSRGGHDNVTVVLLRAE
ncbi:MAG: Stp1/IreP family PP2C-type Ser/Thr phosphatase [Thermoanaerobaculia bacterium]